MSLEIPTILTESEKEKTKSRILSDAELVRGGVEIRDDGSLEVTEEQKAATLSEMEKELKEKDESRIVEIRNELQDISETRDNNPERLLDPNYDFEDFVGTAFRKELLIKFRDYYKTVRANQESEPVTELTNEEKTIAKSVEELPIDDNDKIDLLLVWRKLKPATDLHILGLDSKLSRWNVERKVRKVLEQMDLEYEENFVEEVNHSYKVFMVSPDKSSLTVMKAENFRYDKYLENKKDNPELMHVVDLEKAGMLYGFPETAIQAVIRMRQSGNMDNIKTKNELPPAVQKISSFFYSSDNWQEEVKTSIRWAKEIALICPRLTEAFVKKSV